MKLRDRQILFSDRCDAALNANGNTLGVAPTGAGKTVMGSHIIGRRKPQAGLVIQHREELVTQNRTTFELINPKISTGEYTARRKEWGYGVTFAMIQTLALADNLATMPPIDCMFIDEGHHATADSYRRVVDQAYKLNPDLKLLLLSATPNRGDKKALRSVVSNCADQITLKELIEARHLVPPRTFVIDIGVRDALNQVRKTPSDFDMVAVEAIMNKAVLNERVVSEWQRVAGNRQTVVFCSTVAHARAMAEAFAGAGVKVAVVDGQMGEADRRKTLEAYDKGEIQVLANVAVLTEGWDHQPTSCVILLRPSSYKSTMIQMIGRGLRKVDPERYPGVHKDDCIVIDFGTSLIMHGGIEQDTDLDQKGTKECPECKANVPAQTRECPICGYEWPASGEAPFKICDPCGAENPTAAKVCVDCGEPFPGPEMLDDSSFVLTEISLFDSSPFKWEPMFDGLVWICSAFDSWAVVVSYAGRWHAIGGMKGQGCKHLADNSEKLLSLASADDFMREHGDGEDAGKAKRWLYQPATPKQLDLLRLQAASNPGLTKYVAACHLTWMFNERAIRARLELTQRMPRAA
jgi:superfamily II DNA or RNA helicase